MENYTDFADRMETLTLKEIILLEREVRVEHYRMDDYVSQYFPTRRAFSGLASEKQLKFSNSLMRRHGYKLAYEDIEPNKFDCHCIISVLYGDADSEEFSKYFDIITVKIEEEDG